MDRLELRLSHLKKDKARWRFLEQLYENKIIMSSNLPYACIQVMDVMVRGLVSEDSKDHEKNIAIVQAAYLNLVDPHISKEGSTSYDMRVFYDCYSLGSRKEGPREPLEVMVVLDRKELSLSWRFNGKVRNRSKVLDDFFYCANIENKRFLNSRGAALKKTTKRGELRLGGLRYNLSCEHKNEQVMAFFDRGKVCFFDLYGRGIIPINDPLGAIRSFPYTSMRISNL